MKLPELAHNNSIILQLPRAERPTLAAGIGTVVMNLRRVVLVDDNPDFLAVSREFLEALGGIEVVGTATSAQEALSLIESLKPNVLITDLVMPTVNGLELTQQVKQRWPEMFVIVMTMHDTQRHRDAAINAGASAFVTKPNMDSDLYPALVSLDTNTPLQ